MNWVFKEGIPIYTQLMDHIKTAIASGAFSPGDQILPVRELAMEAGVNPNTMQRALAELEREGLLYSVRTSGRFVTEDKEKLDALRISMSKSFIQEMFTNLKSLGMTDEDVITAVHQYIKGEK